MQRWQTSTTPLKAQKLSLSNLHKHGKVRCSAADFPVCQKTCFLTDWQRSKEPPRQANRTRRRTGGTVAFGLRSKSKCLAQQGLFTNSEKDAFLLLIRQKTDKIANRQNLHFDGWRLFWHSEKRIRASALILFDLGKLWFNRQELAAKDLPTSRRRVIQRFLS